MTHICISKLTIIGSDNGLSPDRRQAIIWTNAGILSIWPLGTMLSEILIAIHIFSFKKMHLKMSSGKWQPCCLGLNVSRLWRAGSLGPWALKIQWGLCYLKQADIPHMKNRVLIKKGLNVNHDWRLLNDKGVYNKLEAVDDDAEFDVWYCLYTSGRCA